MVNLSGLAVNRQVGSRQVFDVLVIFLYIQMKPEKQLVFELDHKMINITITFLFTREDKTAKSLVSMQFCNTTLFFADFDPFISERVAFSKVMSPDEASGAFSQALNASLEMCRL